MVRVLNQCQEVSTIYIASECSYIVPTDHPALLSPPYIKCRGAPCVVIVNVTFYKLFLSFLYYTKYANYK